MLEALLEFKTGIQHNCKKKILSTMKPTLHGYIIVTEHLQLCVYVHEVHLK